MLKIIVFSIKIGEKKKKWDKNEILLKIDKNLMKKLK